MVKLDDFTKQAKDKYDDIIKQEDELKVKIGELQKEKKALKAYLVEKGVVQRPTRKKRTPT